jgi:hypothetical protein
MGPGRGAGGAYRITNMPIRITTCFGRRDFGCSFFSAYTLISNNKINLFRSLGLHFFSGLGELGGRDLQVRRGQSMYLGRRVLFPQSRGHPWELNLQLRRRDLFGKFLGIRD